LAQDAKFFGWNQIHNDVKMGSTLVN
jgi:hypothetical protein